MAHGVDRGAGWLTDRLWRIHIRSGQAGF